MRTRTYKAGDLFNKAPSDIEYTRDDSPDCVDKSLVRRVVSADAFPSKAAHGEDVQHALDEVVDSVGDAHSV